MHSKDLFRLRQGTSIWTRDLVAEVWFEEGLTDCQVSGETIRATLKRMRITWKRANPFGFSASHTVIPRTRLDRTN